MIYMKSSSYYYRFMSHNCDMNFESQLDLVQRKTCQYFIDACDVDTGLPYDRTDIDGVSPNGLISVGGVGFGILALIIASYRGWIARREAASRLLKLLYSIQRIHRFHGAFPHFVMGGSLEMVKFSRYDDGGDLVETALLIQGLICARMYFNLDEEDENSARSIINSISRSVQWDWYAPTRGRPTLYWHWSPKHEWKMNTPITGWNEALICYILAAGSTDFAPSPNVFHQGWANDGSFMNGKKFYGTTLPAGPDFGGPLFLSQYSFCCLDPRNLWDSKIDYFKQAIAHTTINYRHCVANPNSFKGYGHSIWGLTASDGPRGYSINSPTIDSGVIAPTAALSSLPFLPRQGSNALLAFLQYEGGVLLSPYGFVDAFCPQENWIANSHIAINQGPIVAMIENYRSGLLWSLFMRAEEVRRGLYNLGIHSSVVSVINPINNMGHASHFG